MADLKISTSTVIVNGESRVQVYIKPPRCNEASYKIYNINDIKIVDTGWADKTMRFYIEDYPDLITPFPNTATVEFSVSVRWRSLDGTDGHGDATGLATLVSNSYTRPNITDVSITPSNTVLNNDALFVQGKNGAKVSYVSSGQLGASVVSENWSVEGITYEKNDPSGNITSSGNVKVILSATDSRGLTHDFEQTINVYQYSAPRVAPKTGATLVIAKRVDDNNNETERGEGVFIAAGKRWSTINGNNACRLLWRYKEDSVWSDYNELETNENNDYIGRLSGTFSKDKKYSIELSAIDDFLVKSEAIILPISDAIFMHRNGAAGSIAFGGRSTLNNAFEVYQDAYFRGGMGIIIDGNLYNLSLKKVSGELVLVANQILTYKEEE